MATDEQRPWGRVDETGTVFVREPEGERAVGQYPDGTPEEALAYFERKFTELAGQVTLLEQRAKRGAPAADVAKAVKSLTATVSTANAVGNLAALHTRLEALGGTVTELTEKQTAEIGNGGYLNFPAGNAVIDLTLVAKKLKLTTVSVAVRPGFITIAYIRPELR